MTKVFLIKVHK